MGQAIKCDVCGKFKEESGTRSVDLPKGWVGGGSNCGYITSDKIMCKACSKKKEKKLAEALNGAMK